MIKLDRSLNPSEKFPKKAIYVALLATSQLLLSQHAVAGPQGGRVTAGDGSINVSGKATTVTQRSDRLVAEWDSFDVNSDEVVSFLQPGRD